MRAPCLVPTGEAALPGRLAARTRSLLQAFHDLLDNGLLLGELAGLQLGINQVPVDAQLKAPPACRDQFQLADLLLVR